MPFEHVFQILEYTDENYPFSKLGCLIIIICVFKTLDLVILYGTDYYLLLKKALNMGGHFLDIFGCKTKTSKSDSNEHKEKKIIYLHHSLFQPLHQ